MADREFIASMVLFQVGDHVEADIKVADDDQETIEVPAHMAAQLPMAIAMIRMQNG